MLDVTLAVVLTLDWLHHAATWHCLLLLVIAAGHKWFRISVEKYLYMTIYFYIHSFVMNN